MYHVKMIVNLIVENLTRIKIGIMIDVEMINIGIGIMI